MIIGTCLKPLLMLVYRAQNILCTLARYRPGSCGKMEWLHFVRRLSKFYTIRHLSKRKIQATSSVC